MFTAFKLSLDIEKISSQIAMQYFEISNTSNHFRRFTNGKCNCVFSSQQFHECGKRRCHCIDMSILMLPQYNFSLAVLSTRRYKLLHVDFHETGENFVPLTLVKHLIQISSSVIFNIGLHYNHLDSMLLIYTYNMLI